MSSTLTASERRDLAPGLLIGLGTMLIAGLVWGYSVLSGAASSEHAKPTWLGLDKVISQMADGRMIAVKVNFELKKGSDLQALEGHSSAFSSLVQGVAATMSYDELKDTDGIKHYGSAVKTAVNEYLGDRQLDGRVKAVAFEELVLMP
jgi:flagellar basal body-associated protein FliL